MWLCKMLIFHFEMLSDECPEHFFQSYWAGSNLSSDSLIRDTDLITGWDTVSGTKYTQSTNFKSL